ncbi:MAG TPA: DUF6046 domain-containing protein [Segetibacter sp.]|jgi:hypothetical protein
MASLNVFDILSKVYGVRGLPFPQKPLDGDGSAIANGFEYQGNTINNPVVQGTPLREYEDELLGRYLFMPVTIDGYKMPNPLIIINGEQEIVETDLIEVGTVFEKVFYKPYDISIICTLVGENGNWPEEQLDQVIKIWKRGTLLTLKSALSNKFLQSENNFLVTKIAILDNEGAENVEVIQIDGRSNVDFELTII